MSEYGSYVEELLKIGQAHMLYSALIIALLIVILFWFLKRVFKKRGVRNRSHEYLCTRKKKAIIDGIHSFYLSNPKVTFTVAVSDLAARGMIDDNDARCPSDGVYNLTISRNSKGHLFDCVVSCSTHGETCLDEL